MPAADKPKEPEESFMDILLEENQLDYVNLEEINQRREEMQNIANVEEDPVVNNEDQHPVAQQARGEEVPAARPYIDVWAFFERPYPGPETSLSELVVCSISINHH